jgi:putative addiction module component (TIGR02574 family)
MNAALNTEISRLSPTEKLQLVEELWDTLATNPDQLGIPAWHAKLLAEDQAIYQANLTEGSSWADVKSRITGQT